MKIEVVYSANRRTAKKKAKKMPLGSMVAFPIGMQSYGIAEHHWYGVAVKRIHGKRTVYPFHWTQLA